MRESEFDLLIKEHSGSIDNVLVSPALAKHVLDHYNPGNRKLKLQNAQTFAKRIQRGLQVNTGEPIIFAKEGVLNSGQHRLLGVVLAGMPTVMDFRFGIPRQYFSSTDTGSKRVAADVLSIEGSNSPMAAAAALKLLLAYEVGLPASYQNRGIGNEEIQAASHRWSGVIQAINLNQIYLRRRGLQNASTNAFTFLALLAAEEDVVRQFLYLVESGLTRTKQDAPRLLRERMLNEERLRRGDRTSIIERLALFIKAWNHWRAGERPNRLVWKPDEPFPKMDVRLP